MASFAFSTMGKLIRKFNAELMHRVHENLAKRREFCIKNGRNHIEDVNEIEI